MCESSHTPFTLVILVLVSSVVLLSIPAFAQSAGTPQEASATRCVSVSEVKLPATDISTAQVIGAGKFNGPPEVFTGTDLSAFYKSLPAFCRVVAHARPTTDSDIKIEVWLPISGWNGRLQGLGNGGFAGLIDYQQLGVAMSKGYVSTATDTGHTGSPVDAAWALGHPEKVVDFGHRGIHEMTRVAKSLAQALYGSGPKRSYFAGCSDGGREALMEAQRYPGDYDGIVAGAPANYWTGLLTTAVVDTQALTLEPASFIPQSKIPAISAAVVAACDELDGVRDGILNDPRQCHFDPVTIQCKTGEGSDRCLTAPQVSALKKIYDGVHDSHARSVFPGYLPGAEEGPGGWGIWITGPAPTKSLLAFFGVGYFSNMVYGKADWDYKTFDPEAGVKAAEEHTGNVLNATNPDLGSFRARGGKLILYHGWNDPAIPAGSSINYFERVVAAMGQPTTDSFLRMYMLPGVQHCGGGPGPDSIGLDWSTADPQHSVRVALEQWVENGTAPSTIIATKYAEPDHRAIMTRPLCAYPHESKYRDGGDPNDAASFACVVPKK